MYGVWESRKVSDMRLCAMIRLNVQASLAATVGGREALRIAYVGMPG